MSEDGNASKLSVTDTVLAQATRSCHTTRHYTYSAEQIDADGSRIFFSSTLVRAKVKSGFQLFIESCLWSQVEVNGTLPPRRSGALGVVHENNMYIFGGYDGRDGNYFNDLYYFNFGKYLLPCNLSTILDIRNATMERNARIVVTSS